MIELSESLYRAVALYNDAGKEQGLKKILTLIETNSSKEIRANWDYIVKEMNVLYNEALTKLEECEKYRNDEFDKLNKLTESESVYFDEINKDKKILSDLEAEFVGVQSELNSYLRQQYEFDNELAQTNKELSKIEKKCKVFKYIAIGTLLFSPFVSAGMLIALNVTQKKRDAIIGDMVQIQGLINDSQAKLQIIQTKMMENKKASTDMSKKICYSQQEINKILIKLNIVNKSYVAWEILRGLYGRLIEVFKLLDKSVIIECFNEIVLLKEQYDEALAFVQSQEKVGTEEYIRGRIYRGNALYIGQQLGENEYLSSLNRKFTAIMQDDGNFVVYNSQRPIWASGTYMQGEHILDFSKGACRLLGTNWSTKGTAVTLIMENNGNLTAYDADGNSVWSTDTWSYECVDSEPFFIPYDLYNDKKYKIATQAPCLPGMGPFLQMELGQNYLYVGVPNEDINDCAQLTLLHNTDGDNQRFRFEQLPDGACIIKILHSGKVLDVCGGSLRDDANIIQYGLHHGANQQWYILPASKEGYVKFVSKHSSKCISFSPFPFHCKDLPLKQYHDNGAIEQMFKLIPQ